MTQRTRITVGEIADRLQLGERAVYELLEQSAIPAIRFGRRWLIARHAYEQWERNFQVPKPDSIRRLA
jgi:excisionase family DNA binding protein